MKERGRAVYIENVYSFWRIAADIMINHDFDLIQLDEDRNEIWLEKSVKATAYVVRIKQQTFDWSNQLKRDQDHVAQQVKKLSKLLVGRKIEVHNLYISEFPPVDGQNLEKDSVQVKARKPITLHHSFMEKENREKIISTLYQNLGITEKSFPLPSEVEMEQMIPYLKQAIHQRHHKNKKQNEDVFSYGKPLLTYLLIAINVIIFGWLEMNGGSTNTATLVKYGAKYNPAIVDGEWWRIISSMFLHIGLIHISLNMLALFYLGTAVERMFGSRRYFVIYFTSGILGGLASFAFNSSVAAGASGAIYGLFGALLFFGVIYKKLFFRTMGSNLLFILGLNIVFSFTMPQIDNGAHFGGLIGGFLASAFVHFPQKKEPLKQTASLLTVVLLAIGLGWYGLQNESNHYKAALQVQLAQQLNSEKKYTETIEFVSNSMDHVEEDANLYFIRSYAYIKEGKEDKAFNDLKKAVNLNPSFPEAHYNLSILYSNRNQKEEARKHAKLANKLKPNNEQYKSLLQSLEKSG